ncbi:MAG: putative membrane protein YfcA [Cellvibrionaceae bacterium]|jgi:uncharacterized membrane protein YfcA
MGLIASVGWTVVLAGIAIVFIAGLVRGFVGFGYSAICVALLSFLIEPVLVVPLVLMMEVAASGWMMSSVWQDTDFKWLGWTMLGLVIGTPIGVWMLSFLPADTIKVILYSGLALLALAGFAQNWKLIPKLTAPIFVVGIFVGIGNGLAAVAGMIAALFMLSSDMQGKNVRASMVMLFFFADIYALIWGSGFGLIEWRQIQLLGLFLIPLFLSVSIGSWGFRRYGAGNYKGIALGLILAIALLGIGQVLIG